VDSNDADGLARKPDATPGDSGELGVAPAIANAVYHATGVRARDLPITLDKIMRAPAEAST
jgi:CO/xanthine dehydrogenase Mo-binding subunit